MKIGGPQMTPFWLSEAIFSTSGNDLDLFIDFWCPKLPKVRFWGSIRAPFGLQNEVENRVRKSMEFWITKWSGNVLGLAEPAAPLELEFG